MWMIEPVPGDISGPPAAPILMNAETQTETSATIPRAQTRTSAGSNDQFQDVNEISPIRPAPPREIWPTTAARRARARSEGARSIRSLVQDGHLDYSFVSTCGNAKYVQACQCGCGRTINLGDRIVNVSIHQRPARSYRETCWITNACAHDLQMYYLSEHATARRLARNILPEP